MVTTLKTSNLSGGLKKTIYRFSSHKNHYEKIKNGIMTEQKSNFAKDVAHGTRLEDATTKSHPDTNTKDTDEQNRLVHVSAKRKKENLHIVETKKQNKG